MKPKTMMRAGVAGSVLAAVFCLTPALVLGLGAVGLAGAAGWLDYVLLPALVLFVAMAVYGVWRARRS